MEIELKLTTPERLLECLALPASRISLGHDACPHKLSDVSELRRVGERVRKAGRRFSLILPIAYESFQDELIERVQALRGDGPTDLVVNDWGTLLRMAGTPRGDSDHLGIGAGLSFSHEYQPRFAPGAAKEEPETGQSLLSNSSNDPDLLLLFQRCGVSEVQLSTLVGDMTASAVLRAKGFRVITLLDHVAVAFSRSCHTARYRRLAVPECRSACDGAYQLSMTQRWRLFENQLSPLPAGMRRALPTMQVFGNVVYRSIEGDVCPEQTDGCALDVRFYSVEALARRATALSTISTSGHN